MLQEEDAKWKVGDERGCNISNEYDDLDGDDAGGNGNDDSNGDGDGGDEDDDDREEEEELGGEYTKGKVDDEGGCNISNEDDDVVGMDDFKIMLSFKAISMRAVADCKVRSVDDGTCKNISVVDEDIPLGIDFPSGSFPLTAPTSSCTSILLIWYFPVFPPFAATVKILSNSSAFAKDSILM